MRAHAAVMVRDPLQRILSGYFAEPELHDCPRLQAQYNCTKKRCDGDVERDGRLTTNPSVIPPTEYAECVKDCSTNMLTGRSCDSASPPNVSLAIATLREFGFVGLTGEWELSVCLWHAKFGGQPLAAELYNVRPGVKASHRGYDVKGLLGKWRPSSDARVYTAAKEHFRAELERHNLTAKSCAEWLVRAGAKKQSKLWLTRFRADEQTEQGYPAAVYDED